MNDQKIAIVLIDDHSLVRDGIRLLLEGEDDMVVVAEAAEGLTGIEKIREYQPDLAIIDIRMPQISGIETVQRLKDSGSAVKSLILSMHDSEEYVLQSIQAGAMGYLLKDASRDEFLRAIRTIYQGEKYFSAEISQIVINKYLETLQPLKNAKEENEASTEEKVLTKREKQILRLILAGKSNKEIADELHKSIRTIETHRFNLMKKLNARNIIDLSYKAQQFGFVKNT